MTGLEKRLAALYLVVDASVADDIKDHVNAVIKERDRYKAALEELTGMEGEFPYAKNVKNVCAKALETTADLETQQARVKE